MKKGLFMLLSGLLAFSAAKAQEPPKGPEAPVAGQQLVRLSKITVDPARLAGYNAFLQEEIVLALYAVAAKEAPGQVTILEIYADRAAYESHITTPHFRKYKEGTLDMVLSLELVDVVPLMPGLELRQTVGTR